jgi:hypothetical protein
MANIDASISNLKANSVKLGTGRSWLKGVSGCAAVANQHLPPIRRPRFQTEGRVRKASGWG